ncbi:LOW QUALITY PROTEIN: hypothetical protein CFOL_v3_26201, partial [Cephalotus follicularis]
ITLQDLQKEIKDTKQELQKFKQETKKQIKNLEQILLQKHSSSSSSDKEIKPIDHINLEDQEETSTKFIHLIERITYQIWHINITIIIQYSFKLQTTTLIDSGAQMNCIQEGLIQTKYFEKTKQRLSTANGENLRIKFKISDVHICNEGICIKQSFILVKDLDIGIILGQPFLEVIKPFKVKTEGITTKLFQQKIIFAFNEKPITKDINLLKIFSLFKEHSVNLIKTKENHLYFMKQEVSNKKLEQQLQTSQIKKINSLKNNIINKLCSDLPDAFWHRKRYMVSLPYKKDFTKQNIPTKSKIRMTCELMKHSKKEIQELLNKKLIRPSKSPWSCAAFYDNKNSEIERGTPRLVSILFVEKFLDIITDKNQLQRFLGSLNYIRDFIPNLQDLCTPLYQRLRNNPPPCDLLNQKFLIRVDCVVASSILNKYVKNLASKQIFARRQGILSSFDFTIEHIKGDSNSLLDYLTRDFLQGPS